MRNRGPGSTIMALMTLLVITGLMSVALAIGETDGVPVVVPTRFLDGQCLLEADHPGTFKATCSCTPNKTLTLPISATRLLPPALTGFHIQDCNKSAVVIEMGAFNLLHNLERVTFRSIDSLTLETKSINLHLYHEEDFLLTFEDIMGLGLSLEENSIKIQRFDESVAKESLTIERSIIKSLPSFAINGSFSDLLIDEVLLTDLARSNAIDVGDIGTDVTINVLDASNQGLGSQWLSGNVKDFTLTQSNLVLKSRAFAGIKMRGTPLTINITDNRFGASQWNPRDNDTHSEPSLPLGVFDLDIIPTSNVSITADNNAITCECKDLTWILENPVNGLQNHLNFTCIQGNLSTALKICDPLKGNSSAKMMSVWAVILSLAITAILL